MKQLDKEQERAAIALLEALEAVAPAERDAWLDAHAENKLVADRVRSMLAALNRLSLQTGGAQADDLEIGQPPDRIGAYRITGTIGRGGMGTVYLGERDAGDFERVVAIKLIKAGLLSERLVERFGAERQTLAALQHPNIARMYDGGATPQGEPYIVMEYVDGVPILNRCDAACSQDKRLALFADVCAAVAYAHNNLIVHRDITPSNVLVATDDVVKLIDFGIARPAGHVTDDATTRQSLASLTLTPGYAAPERMLGSEATVATDIYSLGKLLDALLDGSRDRELEAIIAKATAGEPDARYSTADALRADITNFRTNLPVTAMRRDRSYLWQKFFARNRIAVIAGAAALGALVIAFAATGWALIRAETARAEAERRFGEVRSLAGFQLFDLYDRLDNVVGNVGARVALAAEAALSCQFVS
jgi:eukaryotic-like serine/threonine-protein kinase